MAGRPGQHPADRFGPVGPPRYFLERGPKSSAGCTEQQTHGGHRPPTPPRQSVAQERRAQPPQLGGSSPPTTPREPTPGRNPASAQTPSEADCAVEAPLPVLADPPPFPPRPRTPTASHPREMFALRGPLLGRGPGWGRSAHRPGSGSLSRFLYGADALRAAKRGGPQPQSRSASTPLEPDPEAGLARWSPSGMQAAKRTSKLGPSFFASCIPTGFKVGAGCAPLLENEFRPPMRAVSVPGRFADAAPASLPELPHGPRRAAQSRPKRADATGR